MRYNWANDKIARECLDFLNKKVLVLKGRK